MKTTTRKLIRNALVQLGVYATGEEVTAEDSAVCFSLLNAITGEYALQPLLKVPEVVYSSLDDEVELTQAQQRLLTLKLAIDAAPSFGVVVGNTTEKQHNNLFVRIKQQNATAGYKSNASSD